MAKKTPLMEQYKVIKAQYQDVILFSDLVRFYEMFYEDAITTSELELTLTGKNAGDGEKLLCGVPFHAAEIYVYRLIQKDIKLLFEQRRSESIKRFGWRGVVRIITPGNYTLWRILIPLQNELN